MQFEQLDPRVQEEFESFLDERGINEELALFIPDYAEYKEQKVCVLILSYLSSIYIVDRMLTLIFLGICSVAEESQKLC